jgi:flagellar biosynthesis/type III secretory pathway protein FliH
MYLLYKTDDLTVVADKVIFSSNEIEEISTASELVNKLRMLVDDKEMELSNSIKQGYENGFKKGADDAYRKYLDTFEESTCTLVKAVSKYKSDSLSVATKMAINIFEIILGEIKPQDIMERIVAKALKQYKKNTKITVKVPIDVVEHLTQYCERVAKSEEYEDCNIDVEGDKSLALYECILVSDYGEAVASLSDQIRNIEFEMAKSITQREMP